MNQSQPQWGGHDGGRPPPGPSYPQAQPLPSYPPAQPLPSYPPAQPLPSYPQAQPSYPQAQPFSPSPAFAPSTYEAARKATLKQLFVGLACVAVGLVITVGGYVWAGQRASGSGGSRYLVLWGPILFGAIRAGGAGLALLRLEKPSRGGA